MECQERYLLLYCSSLEDLYTVIANMFDRRIDTAVVLDAGPSILSWNQIPFGVNTVVVCLYIIVITFCCYIKFLLIEAITMVSYINTIFMNICKMCLLII